MLDSVPVAITSFGVGLKMCSITAGIKMYKPIIKKKKHDKIVLLGKAKLYTIEVLISMALVDSYISHNEFVSVSDALREYNEMKEEITNSGTSIYIYIYIVYYIKKMKNSFLWCHKNAANENTSVTKTKQG